MPKSRLTLELTDNEPLAEVLAGREPGERLCFKVWGKLLDNTSQQASLALDEIEHMAGESDGEGTQTDYGESDEHPMGAIVTKALEAKS